MNWREFLHIGRSIATIFGRLSPVHATIAPEAPARDLPALAFLGNHLTWPIKRSGHSFKVFVVEPSEYRPNLHEAIFSSTMRVMIEGETRLDDDLTTRTATRPEAEPFDLITFPEAFLPLNVCLETLGALPSITNFGCVHVGLRASAEDGSHLISVREVLEFVTALKQIEQVEQSDLTAFEIWLADQHPGDRINVGCLFTLDAFGKKRVCLHPKMVPATIEVSPLAENHMKEGSLLTAVTLEPTDKRYQTITVQPLLCSDALKLDTDRGQGRPMQAMHAHAACLGKSPPDHIDLVSVATCTPQVTKWTQSGNSYRCWHRQFLDAFVSAATDEDYSRHHLAAFVLSNYTTHDRKPGGLSGAFLPTSIAHQPVPNYVVQSAYGKPKAGQNQEKRWSTPDDQVTAGTWETYGHLNYLYPPGRDPGGDARVLGFTVQRFPRHSSAWRQPPWGLTNFKIKTAVFLDDFSALRFAG